MKSTNVINFKTYKKGIDALKLAKIIERFDKDIIVGVQPSHLNEIAKKTKLKVYSQHVDYFKPGRHTGYIIPEAIKKDGAKGTFLNHSEHKLPFRILKKTIKSNAFLGRKIVEEKYSWDAIGKKLRKTMANLE